MFLRSWIWSETGLPGLQSDGSHSGRSGVLFQRKGHFPAPFRLLTGDDKAAMERGICQLLWRDIEHLFVICDRMTGFCLFQKTDRIDGFTGFAVSFQPQITVIIIFRCIFQGGLDVEHPVHITDPGQSDSVIRKDRNGSIGNQDTGSLINSVGFKVSAASAQISFFCPGLLREIAQVQRDGEILTGEFAA